MIAVFMRSRFPLGKTVITRGASSELSEDDWLVGLIRHMNCDWGDLDEYDWKENDSSLEYGYRILSKYTSERGTTFWIITECDRSTTTILLPSEY